MTDLENVVRQAIARIRALPPNDLTTTEISVVEMLETALTGSGFRVEKLRPDTDPMKPCREYIMGSFESGRS